MTMRAIEETIKMDYLYEGGIKHITYTLYDDGTWEKAEYLNNMTEPNCEVIDYDEERGN